MLIVIAPQEGLVREAEWERAAAWKPNVKSRFGNSKINEEKHWVHAFSLDTAISQTRCNYRNMTDLGYATPMGLESMPGTSPVGWFNGEKWKSKRK